MKILQNGSLFNIFRSIPQARDFVSIGYFNIFKCNYKRVHAITVCRCIPLILQFCTLPFIAPWLHKVKECLSRRFQKHLVKCTLLSMLSYKSEIMGFSWVQVTGDNVRSLALFDFTGNGKNEVCFHGHELLEPSTVLHCGEVDTVLLYLENMSLILNGV